MPTSPDPLPRFGSHEPWRQLALALAAGLLGLLANIGAPMLGSGLQMRLDVVIVLCVAITAGPAWAALSATIATSVVCWQVGHPTLMFVAVLEAVAVGSLVRRRIGIALASASFWIAAGVPILYGWSAGILQADSGEATAGALQQALNGVAQAVLVQILAAWPLARAWLRRQHDGPLPLRAQVFDSVIPLAVCPVIVLGLGLGRVVASGEEQDIRRELVERAAIIGSRIDEHLRAHDLAAASLALRVGAAPVSDVEAEGMLVSAQRVYGDFDKIVLLDRAGNARVGASVLTGGARPFAVTGSSATRDWFTVPMQTGQNYRSNVFLGNGYDRTVPEVVVSAAVVTPSGAREGIIKGSLNLSRIGRIAGDLVDPGGTSLM
ncbi:MAG: cache domain-containing protein, partial [Vicinamibacteria bacterium]